MVLGIDLTVKIGPKNPRLAPDWLIEAIDTVEVQLNDIGRSGFQINFNIGRSGATELQYYKLLSSPLLQPFSRVILIVRINAIAQVLMDGIITNHQFSPSMQPGRSTFTITGEDVSVMMDMEEKSIEHRAKDETTIVQEIISKYSEYGLVAIAKKPSAGSEQPPETERTPVQTIRTDLGYIQELAARFAYVFYVTPGPTSGENIAYWGPPKRQGSPQKALSMNMGPYSNIESIRFSYNALAATKVQGKVQFRTTNQQQPVQDSTSDRTTLAKRSALTSQSHVKTVRYKETSRDAAHANARAQAMLDSSVDNVISASGELDTFVYGGLLLLRGIVGLRGVGTAYDGLYYVKSVTHKISKGEYKQSFTLTREGLDSTIQKVRI
jgi:hypothetical protein